MSTIHDVATAARVSPKTVSRVPSGDGPVGPVTGAISLDPEQPALAGLPDLFLVPGVKKSLEDAGMTLMTGDESGEPHGAITLIAPLGAETVVEVMLRDGEPLIAALSENRIYDTGRAQLFPVEA